MAHFFLVPNNILLSQVYHSPPTSWYLEDILLASESWQLAIWYFFAALLIMLAIQNYFGGVHVENIPYSDFKALLKAGKVSEVAIRDDAIVGTLKNEGLEQVLLKATVDALAKLSQGEHKFVTVRVSDPALIQDLEAAKVRFAGQVESKWLSTLLSWILP